VFDSFKASFKVAGAVVLALVLCLAMATAIVACGGGDATETTVEVATTVAEATATTAAEGTATSEVTAAIDEALVGKWSITAAETGTGTGGTLEFTADGKMTATSDDPAQGVLEFTYTADGANLIVSMAGAEQSGSTYVIEGNILTITDSASGEAESYTRVDE
jgi:hypothetical protein